MVWMSTIRALAGRPTALECGPSRYAGGRGVDDYGGRGGCPEIGMVWKVRTCAQGFREQTISRLEDGEIRAFAGVVFFKIEWCHRQDFVLEWHGVNTELRNVKLRAAQLRQGIATIVSRFAFAAKSSN